MRRDHEEAAILLSSASAFQPGGMERVMQSLGRELPRRGLTTRVCIPNSPMAADMQRWFAQFGVQADVSVELGRVAGGGPQAFLKYAETLRRARIRLVNIHSPGPHVPLKEVLAARFAGLPVVTSIHGYDADDSRPVARTLLNALLSSPLNASVVAMNRAVFQQQRRKGIPGRKLRLIYNGAPGPDHPPNRSAARARLCIPQDVFVITTFGRLVVDKGIDTLIEAVNALPDSLLACCQTFIGGLGPESDRYQSLVQPRAREVIRFLGHVEDTSTYYEASDVFALPSRHEPFGLVYLEAAQYALPCIGTRVGGIPEIIVDGQTGVLVNPERPDQLASAIVLLASDAGLRERLGTAARLRVQRQFSIEAMVDGYANLFRSLLRSAPS